MWRGVVKGTLASSGGALFYTKTMLASPHPVSITGNNNNLCRLRYSYVGGGYTMKIKLMGGDGVLHKLLSPEYVDMLHRCFYLKSLMPDPCRPHVLLLVTSYSKHFKDNRCGWQPKYLNIGYKLTVVGFEEREPC